MDQRGHFEGNYMAKSKLVTEGRLYCPIEALLNRNQLVYFFDLIERHINIFKILHFLYFFKHVFVITHAREILKNERSNFGVQQLAMVFREISGE